MIKYIRQYNMKEGDNININNLGIGQVIKNYKELCKILNWEITGGNSKKLQLKDLKRYCKYHKEGNKYIIDEIFEEPFPKQENKRNSGYKTTYKELNIKESEFNNIGIYYIIKDNDIYIGSTKKSFRIRFQEHYYGYDELMQHTYDLLKNGGIFNILNDMTGIEDIELIRMVENEFINYFLFHTNYNVINKISGWNLNKIKYKTIRIKEHNYNEAIQLLIKHGLIEVTEDVDINEFDIRNK
jgi:hypothetical protein